MRWLFRVLNIYIGQVVFGIGFGIIMLLTSDGKGLAIYAFAYGIFNLCIYLLQINRKNKYEFAEKVYSSDSLYTWGLFLFLVGSLGALALSSSFFIVVFVLGGILIFIQLCVWEYNFYKAKNKKM